MKNLLFLLLCLPIIGFGQIYFEELNFGDINIKNCHNCPGKLVVKKDNLLDTLYIGSWGYLPDYKIIKIDNKECVFVKSSWFGGGVLTTCLQIYSTEENIFLKKIFSEIIVNQIYYYDRDEFNSYKKITKELKYEFNNSFLVVDIDTVVFIGSDKKESEDFVSKGSLRKKYKIINE